MKKGFTLTELLIVLIIMIFIVSGTLTVYLMCYTTWKESTVRVSLQREGSIIMERLVRGVRGPSETKKHGIREAKSFVIPVMQPHRIKFTSGIDNKDRSFYLREDGKIMYNPDLSLLGNEIAVAEGIKSLRFEELSNKRLGIKISLKDSVRDKVIVVNLETDVTIRN